MEKLLVIEDDQSIAKSMAYRLRQEGYEVEMAHDGGAGLTKFRQFQPDLVLLDLMLPGMPGLEVFRELRRKTDVPVIIVTAKGEESDRVTGIELGADDYIVKPFYMRELLARLRMILKRARTGGTKAVDESQAPLRIGDLVIDLAGHTVLLRGQEVELRRKEFALLATLARNRGRVLTRTLILEQAWGDDQYVDEHTVDVHVSWLRMKLEDEPRQPRRLVTVRGVGYKLVG